MLMEIVSMRVYVNISALVSETVDNQRNGLKTRYD